MSYRFTMGDERAEKKGAAPNATAIAAAHAIYTPFMLSFYDRLVHGLSNRFAWRCPTERLIGLYQREKSAGEGPTSFFQRVGLAEVKSVIADLEPLTEETAEPEDFIDLGETETYSPEVMDGECAS